MEVGVRRGAHFQLSRRGDRPIPITWRNPMKRRLILLFTPDRTFDQLVRESVLARRNLDRRGILLTTMAANVNQSRYCQYD